MDSLQDLRTEMVLLLQEVGIEVELHHHEVATAGQCEIDMKFDKLVSMADNLLKFKYIIKNTARRYNKTVAQECMFTKVFGKTARICSMSREAMPT